MKCQFVFVAIFIHLSVSRYIFDECHEKYKCKDPNAECVFGPVNLCHCKSNYHLQNNTCTLIPVKEDTESNNWRLYLIVPISVVVFGILIGLAVFYVKCRLCRRDLPTTSSVPENNGSELATYGSKLPLNNLFSPANDIFIIEDWRLLNFISTLRANLRKGEWGGPSCENKLGV